MNPLNCPTVCDTLIDLDCSEDYLKTLLQSVRAACPVETLVEECEKRNRLLVCLPCELVIVTIPIWACSLAPRLSTTHPPGGPVDCIWPPLQPPPSHLKWVGLPKGLDVMNDIVYIRYRAFGTQGVWF